MIGITRETFSKTSSAAGASLAMAAGLLLLSPISLFATTLLSFQAGDGAWQMGSLAVGKITANSGSSIVVPYRDSSGNWRLDAFNSQGSRRPGFPYPPVGPLSDLLPGLPGAPDLRLPINVSPTLADLDGDGIDEIIFTRGPHIEALRGDGTLLWSQLVSWENYVPDAGYQAVTNGFYWSGTGLWQPLLPPTAQFFSEVSSPMAVDVYGDGNLAILTAWKIDPDSLSREQDYNPAIFPLFGFGEWGTVGEEWSGGVILQDALTGRRKMTYHLHQLVEAGLAVGHAEDSPGKEIYVLNDSDSVVAFNPTKQPGFFGKGMLHKQFGKNQRLMSGSYLKGVDVFTADIDGDGFDEVLVPSTQWDPNWQPNETILDDDGAVLWRKWKEPVSIPNSQGWLNNACMIPINPDHDNHIDVLTFSHSYELAFRYWNGIELVDRPGWPKNFYPLLPTPPVVGDIDGDGAEEIILGTYDPSSENRSGKLYIFSLDGTEKVSETIPGGIKQIPFLADVNGDGSMDLIFRSTEGRIYVQNYGAKPDGTFSWLGHRGGARREGHGPESLWPAGTPVIQNKTAGYKRASIEWQVPKPFNPLSQRIYRSEDPNGPFQLIATLSGAVRNFADGQLKEGVQYIYEIEALYSGSSAKSAPTALLSLYENNLVANGGFEEDDDSHWDKWFTGDIPYGRMRGASDVVYQGRRAMEIWLDNDGSSSSIKQSNQYGIPAPAIPVQPGTLYSFGGFFRSGGISNPSSHWLEWNSSVTAENTNARPNLPWPNYFTPPFQVGLGASDWTYANRVFVMPNGFPNVELRHRFEVGGRVSGSIYLDNIFFRPLPPVDSPVWQRWLSFGSNWRFQSTEPPHDWTRSGFDDSTWPEGKAKFGAGSGPVNIATQLPQFRSGYYFRGAFTVPPGSVSDLLLGATCTDDFGGKVYPLEIFLNGIELQTSGINAVSGDGNAAIYYDLTPFLGLLHTGLNVIAVRLNNGFEQGWDNVAFDLSLQAVAQRDSNASGYFKLLQKQPDGSVKISIAGWPGQTLSLESCDGGPIQPIWQPFETFQIPTEGDRVIFDVGQNGRGSPATAPSRFYRLQQR